MKYVRTHLATDWRKSTEKTLFGRIVASLVSKLRANPDYDAVLPSVASWLVEFDDDGMPGREVGLDKSEIPVIAGPDDRNYGFWLDTNMKLGDFVGEEIDLELFEEKWQAYHVRSNHGAGAA